MSIEKKEISNVDLIDSNKENYTLEDYLSMPYKSVMNSTGESGESAYFAEILELDGCCAEGATPAETYEALREELTLHIQMYINKGITPPMPKPTSNKTVKVLVRMPATLQQKLAMRAKVENISINQLIVNNLSYI